MIHETLDTLPIKLYYKISETNNITLLSDEQIEETKLISIWNKLINDFDELNASQESKQAFIINKEISSLKATHKFILMACECLSFEYNTEIILLLKKYGFAINDNSTEDYYNSIDNIQRQAKSILTKIDFLEKQLPKKEKESKLSLDDVMASYSSVLGIDFDYNLLPCTKFFALKKQVLIKVKSTEKQLSNGKR